VQKKNIKEWKQIGIYAEQKNELTKGSLFGRSPLSSIDCPSSSFFLTEGLALSAEPFKKLVYQNTLSLSNKITISLRHQMNLARVLIMG
jgi:hypothetical protein